MVTNSDQDLNQTLEGRRRPGSELTSCTCWPHLHHALPMRDSISPLRLKAIRPFRRRRGAAVNYSLLFVVCFLAGRAFADSYSVTIKVLGNDDQPVVGAEASLFWQVSSGAMKSISKESGRTDANGKTVLRMDDRNEMRPVLVFSADRKLGGVVGVSKTNEGKELTVTLVPTVRARGRLVSTELNSKPEWANTMVTPDGFRSRFAQDMGNSAEFNFVLPAGKYSFNSYGSDVENKTQTVTLVAESPEHDFGTIDLKATAIARLKGKPAPAWEIAAARGVKPTAKLSDYKGKWVFLEFWGFW